MQSTREQTQQMQATTAALHNILGDALIAVYLHGSAVSGKLQPQSDIDLLVVVDRSLTDDQRNDLLTSLLQLSGTHPRRLGHPRCIEVIMFLLDDLAETGFPARAEFIYGEWLRHAFEEGEKPMPTKDPEHTLVLAQARQKTMPLFGPSALELLPEIPPEHVRQAMREALQPLLNGLRGDERNVLLTLARMWYTATIGEFVTKDVAAAWVFPQIRGQDAMTMDYARRAYLGEIVDEWASRSGDAQQLAERMHERIIELLKPL